MFYVMIFFFSFVFIVLFYLLILDSHIQLKISHICNKFIVVVVFVVFFGNFRK